MNKDGVFTIDYSEIYDMYWCSYKQDIEDTETFYLFRDGSLNKKCNNGIPHVEDNYGWYSNLSELIHILKRAIKNRPDSKINIQPIVFEKL
jgi:hypothetical protein